MKLSYRQMALAFAGLAAVSAVLYGILFYFGSYLVNVAGLSTGGTDHITGRVIWVACAVPAVLIGWMALAFRRQLLDGAAQGLG